MPERPDTEDYRALFLRDTPMADLRSPGEFAHGAFPSASSLPLMTDAERAEVGTCYKQNGQRAAIELGHRLVCGEVRAARLAQWVDFARRYPDGYLYCFRGGLRSQTVQQWLREAGIRYPLVRGGYKAMRRFLLDELERSVAVADIVLISGKTGTGKTRVITRLERAVDLEGLAGHRGSTFGQLPQPQPSQIDFENAVSIALLKLLARGSKRVYLEDEGRLIGRLYLPAVLRECMASAPLAVVEQSLDERVDVVVEDYVVDLGQRYEQAHGAQGFELHSARLQDDLRRIRKRLGSERHGVASELMADAFARQRGSGDLRGHRAWITLLLESYYDPMYEYQMAQRSGPVLFRGDRRAVIDWAVAGTPP
jgi:tRNA 2-selenouridine synthase